MSDTHRGYEIRHRTVRDGEGFPRYNAEINVRGVWQFASCEALDDETIERDLDDFITKLEAPHLSRQARAATQNGDHKWCSSAMDTNAGGERGKGMITPSTPSSKTKPALRRAACLWGLIVLAVIEPSLGAVLVAGNLSEVNVWRGFLLLVGVFVAVVAAVTAILILPVQGRNN